MGIMDSRDENNFLISSLNFSNHNESWSDITDVALTCKKEMIIYFKSKAMQPNVKHFANLIVMEIT